MIFQKIFNWKKLKMRGYNQCDSFAEGLSEGMGIPWSATAIERVHENISQTKKKRLDRWGNVAEIFSVKDEMQLRGKHILLVDDVMTTGSTLAASVQLFNQIEGCRVSVMTMAYAE